MKEQNIFEELGVRDPQEMLLKAKIAVRIMDEIRERGLTQAGAAKLMGIPQPTVSGIIRGQFRGISLERLMAYLRKFDPDYRVELVAGTRNRQKATRRLAEPLAAATKPNSPVTLPKKPRVRSVKTA